jgi:hypothetical protein
MRTTIFLSSLIFLSLFGFCSKENPVEPEREVVFTALTDAIRIENRSNWEVHFFPVEQSVSTRIDWMPHCTVGSQNQIPCGKSAYINYLESEILGYYTGCDVVIHWWFCSADDEFVGSIRSVSLETK